MQNYASPLNNLTLSFYIPYQENATSVVLHRLQYNNTFFNIDYLNNYFAFLTCEDINYDEQKHGLNIIDIPPGTETKQYLLTVIRIPPGIYNNSTEIIKAINKSYREAYSDSGEQAEKASKPLIGYKKEITTETTGTPRNLSTVKNSSTVNADGSKSTTLNYGSYVITTTEKTDGTKSTITYKADGTILTTEEEWIEDINEDDKLVYFTQELLPVNISLNITNDINLSLIDNVLENVYTKASNILTIKDNKIIFEKAGINDNIYYTLYDSYNNFSFNSNVSLSNYLLNNDYIAPINSDNCIKIREGDYVNMFCYLGDTIKTISGDEKNTNLLTYSKVYSSRRKLEPNQLTELDVKYSCANNINDLINKNVNSFNIVRERLELTKDNNFILPINGKVNMIKSGVYIYCVAHNELTQVITNNACKLYYSYVSG